MNPHFIRIQILIIIISVCGFFCSISAETARRFYSISKEATLTNSSVLCLTKDSREFIWIGTQDGMNRYDGFRSKQYRWTTDSGQMVTYINQIKEDDDGNFWITSHEGLFKFNPETEQFEDIFGSSNQFKGNEAGIVLWVEIVADGTLWIGSYNGLIHLNPKTLDYEQFTGDPDGAHSLPQGMERLGYIFSIDDDNLLLGSFGGLLTFNIPTHQFTTIHPSDFGLDFPEWSQIYHIMRSSDGIYWLSTRLNGLVAIDPTFKFATGFNQTAEAEELKKVTIYGTIEGSENEIWISTDFGLRSYDSEEETLSTYVRDLYDPYSIGSNLLNSQPIIEDNFLWLPTRFVGLWYTDLSPSMFAPYTALQKNGLNYPTVSNFEVNKNGDLYVATDGGGINVIHASDNSFHYYTKDEPPYYLPTNKTLGFIIDKKGRHWIGTWNEGLISYDPQTGERKHFLPDPKNPNSLGGSCIYHIMEDTKGNIWVATWDNGVFMYDDSSEQFIQFTNNTVGSERIVASPICTLMQDRDGYIWIGSEIDGITRLNPDTRELKNYRYTPGKVSLTSNSVNCFWQSPEGLILIGTNGGGLNVFDPEKESFINHTILEHITTESIFGVQGDAYGKLWFSTNKGVLRYNQETFEVSLYTKKDGLHDNIFGRWADIRLTTGELIFGGANGFTKIQPKSSELSESYPVPYITEICANNKFITSNLKHKPGFLMEIHEFPSKIESLRFEFTAPWYRGADRIQFQYMLEGIDKHWVDWRDSRMAQYPMIGHGNYRFKVRVSDPEGKWNETQAVFSFVIATPFWARWYTRLSLIFVGILIIIGISKWRSYHHKNREMELEKRIQQRTCDLNESNRLLSDKKIEIEGQNKKLKQLNKTKDRMISIFAHDIKNPFSALLNLTDILHNDYSILNEKKRSRYVEYIRITAYNIHELLENLLYWSLSQDNNLPFRPKNGFLNKIFTPPLKLYETIARQQSIHLTYDIGKFNIEVFVDKQLVTMVMRNLLNNAIKFTPKGGSIEIDTNQTQSHVIISVSNTGTGISEQQSRTIFENILTEEHPTQSGLKGTGIGLPLCKEIIDMHKGDLYLDQDYHFGARFVFTIPVRETIV